MAQRRATAGTADPGFEPVRRASIARQVAEQIRRRIFAGTLRPGERLPPERELSEQVGSNRNTVREAIRTLEQLHLVEVRHGNGVEVRDFRREAELGLLPFFLAEASDPAETLRALQDVLRLRRLVGVEAAALAAERAAPGEVAKLRDAAARVGSGGPEAWRRELEFFRALVDASRSLVAIWVFNTFARAFVGVMERLPGLWVERPGQRRTLERLVAAVQRHRPAEARRILDRHFAAIDRVVNRLVGGTASASPAAKLKASPSTGSGRRPSTSSARRRGGR